MFTGIIQKLGTVVAVTPSAHGGRLLFSCAPWERPYEKGESIAVNGVCLSLVAVHEGGLIFDVLQETFDKTNLGNLKPGAQVNLERALRYGDALGGHLVSGHIDGTGTVSRIESVGRDKAVTIFCSPEILQGIVYKGSIAADGISLTVAALTEDCMTLHLIPMTLEHTNWGALHVGDSVNLEVDLLTKYVARALRTGKFPLAPSSWNELIEEKSDDA